MEAFQVLISAVHHALVDVSDPPGMSHDKAQSKHAHEDICLGKTYQHIADACDNDGTQKGYHLDGELHAILEVTLRRDLLLQRERLFIIDGKLEDDEMQESAD